MYRVNVLIEGSAPLLQHGFGQVQLATLQDKSTKRAGTPDYSLEWMDTMYTSNGYVVQPAAHIEAAMVGAAVSYKIKGARGKSWKDAVRAYVYVNPDMIVHLRDGEPVPVPDETLLQRPRNGLSVSIMRVVVSRSAVARSRLMIDPGWQLAFSVDVIEDQLPPDLLQLVLSEAGRSKGIGDFRPRYGRFEVIEFNVLNGK